MVRIIPVLLLAATLGCQSGKDFKILGYSTTAPFDPDIKTVYVPVFKNSAFQTTTNRDLEVDITAAVVKEISSRTPMRVTSDRDKADTELFGTLVKIEKLLLNRTPQNFAREVELSITVQVVWRDLRSGKVLSNPRIGRPATAPVEQFDPSLPPPEAVAAKEKPIPVTIVATGRVLPELGESNATGLKMATDKLAKQIVNMMEAPW